MIAYAPQDILPTLPVSVRMGIDWVLIVKIEWLFEIVNAYNCRNINAL